MTSFVTVPSFTVERAKASEVQALATNQTAMQTGFCLAQGATGQSMTGSAFTVIDLTVATEDPLSMIDTSSNRITIPTGGGVWHIHGQITYNGTSGGRGVFLKLNGSTYLASTTAEATATDSRRMQVSRLRRFSANDYIELVGWTSTGDTTGDNTYGGQFLSAHRIGP